MTMENRRTILKALAAALITPFVHGCITPSEPVEKNPLGGYDAVTGFLRVWIENEMKAAQASNLSIALLDGQQVIWSEGFGFADVAAAVPATGVTRYRAGSISKVFTAMAVMRLAEAGKLDIDAPLTQALPGFCIKNRDANASPVTPRNIMTHHSGLPSDRDEGMWVAQPMHFSAMVEAMRDEYLATPPGFMYAYSNLGFSLLGAAIEHASGMAFERYMQEKLLTPLGMRDSAFESSPPVGLNAAMAYDGQGEPGQEIPLRDTPAGGLNTTVTDLLQLARMWFAKGVLGGERLLGIESLHQMQQQQYPDDSPLDTQMMGLGWHFLPEDGALQGGEPVLWHSGSTLHHHSSLMLLPEHQLAVAVMSSSTLASELVETVSGKALALLLETRTGIVQPEGNGMPRPVDARYPAQPASSFAGYFDTLTGLAEIVSEKGILRLPSGPEGLYLSPLANGYFHFEQQTSGAIRANLGGLEEVEYTHAKVLGHEVLLARKNGRFRLAGTRLEPVSIPSAWLARLGDYRYIGSDAVVAEQVGRLSLKVEHGFLIAEIQDKSGESEGKIALEPVNDNEAIRRGLGRGRGDTVHVRLLAGSETLHYSGLIFKRAGAA